MTQQLTLESSIADYIHNAPASFTLSDAINIAAPFLETETDEGKFRSVRSCIDMDCSTFCKLNDDKTFFTRAAFFEGKYFSIKRTEFEVKNKILISGGRFAPFAHNSIFPTELTLLTDSSKKIPQKVIEISIEEAAAHYYLLGAEEMFHSLEADDERNPSILSQANPEANIYLTVYDLTEYENFNSIKVKIDNFNNGVFTLCALTSYDYTKEPSYLKAFEEALCQTFDQWSTYIELPEQIAQALFYSQNVLSEKDLFDMEWFLARSKLIEIEILDSRTLLWRNDEAIPEEESQDEENEQELPEGLALTQAETGSVESILNTLKCPLNSIEIISFMYDELYMGSNEFERFFLRLLDAWPLDFEDELQEIAFKNELEMVWEELSESYNRVFDNDRGKVRHLAIKINNERLHWLHRLAQKTDALPTEKQTEQLQLIAKHAAVLHRLMNALNQGTVIENPDEFEEMLMTLSTLGDQAQLLMREYATLND